MAFVKQSFCVLHVLIVKIDLKVLLYSSDFQGNHCDKLVKRFTHQWWFVLSSSGLSVQQKSRIFSVSEAVCIVVWWEIHLYLLTFSFTQWFFILIETSSYFCQFAFLCKSVSKHPERLFGVWQIKHWQNKANSEPVFVKCWIRLNLTRLECKFKFILSLIFFSVQCNCVSKQTFSPKMVTLNNHLLFLIIL